MSSRYYMQEGSPAMHWILAVDRSILFLIVTIIMIITKVMILLACFFLQNCLIKQHCFYHNLSLNVTVINTFN